MGRFLVRVEWLPVTSRSHARTHARTDKYKISIMVCSCCSLASYRRMLRGSTTILYAQTCKWLSRYVAATGWSIHHYHGDLAMGNFCTINNIYTVDWRIVLYYVMHATPWYVNCHRTCSIGIVSVTEVTYIIVRLRCPIIIIYYDQLITIIIESLSWNCLKSRNRWWSSESTTKCRINRFCLFCPKALDTCRSVTLIQACFKTLRQ